MGDRQLYNREQDSKNLEAWKTIGQNLWQFVSQLPPTEAQALADQSNVFVAPSSGFGAPPPNEPVPQPGGLMGPPHFAPQVSPGSQQPVATPGDYSMAPSAGVNPVMPPAEPPGMPGFPRATAFTPERGPRRETTRPRMNPNEQTRTPGQKRGGSGGGGPATGADVAKTGSVTNPTSKMDDDEDLKATKAAMDRYLGREQQLDLMPVMALTDSWVKGSNLSQGYRRPMSADDRAREELQLRTGHAESEANLKYKKAYLSQQAEAAKAAEAFRRDKLAQDRELGMARISATKAARAASAASSDAFGTSKEDKARETWLGKKGTRQALETIAQKMYGKRDEDGNLIEGDRGGASMANVVGSDVWEFGKHLEATGKVPKGQGLARAMEYFMAKGAGPDSAGGSGGEE